MNVVVTGGHGQVGMALSATAPEGCQVNALSRDDLDITNPTSIRKALETFAPSLVINAASYTAVDRAEEEEEQAFCANARGVGHLTKACSMQDIPLVHFSTDFVFDGSQSRPYATDDEPAPLGIYGRSKLVGEQAALGDPRNLVIRTAWVYGNHGSNFVRTMLQLMRETPELRVVSDQVGTPTHARSLARASWSLIARGVKGLHHFTDAGVASWFDFAVAIQEEALRLGLLAHAIPILPITTSEFPTAATRPAYSVLDKAATWRMLGGAARHWRVELRDMLAAEVDSYA